MHQSELVTVSPYKCGQQHANTCLQHIGILGGTKWNLGDKLYRVWKWLIVVVCWHGSSSFELPTLAVLWDILKTSDVNEFCTYKILHSLFLTSELQITSAGWITVFKIAATVIIALIWTFYRHHIWINVSWHRLLSQNYPRLGFSVTWPLNSHHSFILHPSIPPCLSSPLKENIQTQKWVGSPLTLCKL